MAKPGDWRREDVDPTVELRFGAAPAELRPGQAMLTRAAAERVCGLTRWRAQTWLEPGERFGLGALERDAPGLDAHGIVKRGHVVGPGDVLIAIGRAAAETSELDAQLGSLFGEETQLEDTSLRCPAWIDGEVVEVGFVDEAETKVELVIEQRRAVRVGDAIEAKGRARLNVAAVVDELPGGAEAAAHGLEGRHLARYGDRAAEHLRGVSIGPVDPATQQPLVPRTGAQVLLEPHLRALLLAGATHNLSEMLSLKSDDRDGARELYTSVFDRPVPAPALPTAASGLMHDMRRMGLRAHLQEDPVRIELLTAWDRAQNAEPLPVPLLHPFAIDAVARLLGRPPGAVRRTLYDGQTLDGHRAPVASGCGAGAIRAALAAVDLEALAASGLSIARDMLASKTAPAALVYEAWAPLWTELPEPGRGPHHQLAHKLALGARLFVKQRAATEQVWTDAQSSEAAKVRTQAALQRALDRLLLGGGEDSACLLDRVPLRCLQKAVEYSGVGNVVARSEVAIDEVLVPARLAEQVLRPQVYYGLEQAGVVERIKEAKAMADEKDPRVRPVLEQVANGRPVLLFTIASSGPKLLVRRMRLWDEDAFALRDVDAYRLQIHVPVTPRACAEAAAMLEGPLASELSIDGWFARVAFSKSRAPLLIEAALRGEADPVRDVYTRAFLGRPMPG